jgi:hypothetical protein
MGIIGDEIYGQLFASPSFIWSVVAILGLFVFIIFAVIFQKARRPKSTDNILSMTLGDVDSLNKKGLLTPEEAARVRRAVAKQVTSQLQERPSPYTPATLLADPEVQRLEALAQARAAEAALREAEQAHPTDILTAALQSSEPPPQAQQPDGDVELPPDVMSMVQLGLITPGELERIKERARTKRREAGL